jgi:hypothetical protein
MGWRVFVGVQHWAAIARLGLRVKIGGAAVVKSLLVRCLFLLLGPPAPTAGHVSAFNNCLNFGRNERVLMLRCPRQSQIVDSGASCSSYLCG